MATLCELDEAAGSRAQMARRFGDHLIFAMFAPSSPKMTAIVM
jgi:hypothetical protein